MSTLSLVCPLELLARMANGCSWSWRGPFVAWEELQLRGIDNCEKFSRHLIPQHHEDLLLSFWSCFAFGLRGILRAFSWCCSMMIWWSPQVQPTSRRLEHFLTGWDWKELSLFGAPGIRTEKAGIRWSLGCLLTLIRLKKPQACESCSVAKAPPNLSKFVVEDPDQDPVFSEMDAKLFFDDALLIAFHISWLSSYQVSVHTKWEQRSYWEFHSHMIDLAGVQFVLILNWYISEILNFAIWKIRGKNCF